MPLPTDFDSLLARVDALRDEITAMRPLTDEQAGRAMQRLRLEWNYHSNAIEGNSLTYGETRALLMEGVTAHGKPLKDHLDIERHRDVVLYIEAFVNSDEPLRVDFVKEIHHRLMGDEYEIEVELPDGRRERRARKGGDYKKHPNNVRTPTGEIHYYAPPVEVPGRMAELMEWLRGDEVATMHPVARLAVFHHRFVEIHPFPDGNGRTSRVLMNILSMRDGYVPAVLRQERRSVYYGALAEAGAGDDEPIIAFVAGELAETMELYLRTLKGEPDSSLSTKRIALLKRRAESVQAVVSAREVSQEHRDELVSVLIGPLARQISASMEELKALYQIVAFSMAVDVGDKSTTTYSSGELASALGLLAGKAWLTISFDWKPRSPMLAGVPQNALRLKVSAEREVATLKAFDMADSMGAWSFAYTSRDWLRLDPGAISSQLFSRFLDSVEEDHREVEARTKP